ncbi:MAG: lipid A biosynthesis acyltransferase [Gammaproteobacteria bacterium]|nr:lipid A biosynthesis acyltransferase [Gammaproteobacteria bacterium]
MKFIHPKFWPTWLVYGCMIFVTHLPHKIQINIGAFLGKLGYLLARKRRHIAEVNISLCFPSLTDQQQNDLVRQICRSSGIGLVETANSWIRDPMQLRHRVTVKGLNHLQNAIDQGRGVLLVGMHFSTLDLCGAVLSSYIGFDVMYRSNKNELLEAIMTRGREKNFPSALERDDIRGVLKSLKKGHAVWYGPDQDYGRKHSVFAPFFGVEAATITATARFAKISNSPVIFFSHYRTGDDNQYIIELSEVLQDFPSGNEVADATLINSQIEKAINTAPEQYWWIHRRFKTRPEGEARPY